MASAERDQSRCLRSGLFVYVLAQLLLSAPAVAEDEELPDLEMLAYLGSWLESDEEWEAVVEWDGKIDAEAPKEPAPSEENDDE